MTSAAIQPLRQAAENFWRQRKPRERLALGAMIGVLAVALLAQLMWAAHEGSQRLRRQLPRLAEQVEQLKADADEWRRLSALAARQPSANPAGLQQEIAASAQGLGLSAIWKNSATVSLSGQAAFDDWVAWLGRIHRDNGLAVSQARVMDAGAGRVRVEAELTLVGSGQ